MKNIKINMCCGVRDFGPDWINIDKADFPHIHYRDVTKLPFRNNEVDLIYCSHGICYWDRFEIINILNEWKRVLKPGGILRLATPDFEEMAHLYCLEKIELADIVGPLYGKMQINNGFAYHKTTYNFLELSTLLQEVGFKNLDYYNWWETSHRDMDDHSQAYLAPKGDKENGTLISLNIECTK